MIVEYQALNSSGTMVSDTISVDDQQGAYAELKRRGLTPIRISSGKAVSQSPSNPIQAWLASLSGPKQALPKRASKKELPFFTTQMSIMLETGTPVAASLNAMELQMTCPHWRALVGICFGWCATQRTSCQITMPRPDTHCQPRSKGCR